MRLGMVGDYPRNKIVGKSIWQMPLCHWLVHCLKPAAMFFAFKVEERPAGVAAREVQVKRPLTASSQRLVQCVFNERTYFHAVHRSIISFPY